MPNYARHVHPVNEYVDIIIDGDEEDQIKDVLYIPWVPIEGVPRDELEALQYKSVLTFVYHLESVYHHKSPADTWPSEKWNNMIELRYKLAGVKGIDTG